MPLPVFGGSSPSASASARQAKRSACFAVRLGGSTRMPLLSARPATENSPNRDSRSALCNLRPGVSTGVEKLDVPVPTVAD